MCRWLAYSGNPVPLRNLILDTEHSLIDQSLSARASVQTTNGDGFGVGWYDDNERPGLYRSISPAWNDSNLRELCHHIRSPVFVAHVRAATSTPIQQTNCHPFRYDNWLFVHNGVVRHFDKVRREMLMAVDPSLFNHIGGSTDSELMLMLALTFGMADDVYSGVSRMVGFIEDLGSKAGIDAPLQMTLGITDGTSIHAFRYSSENTSRTLYYSASVAALREIIPAEHRHELEIYGEDALSIVSEPLHSLEGGWQAVPESTYVRIEAGKIESREFGALSP